MSDLIERLRKVNAELVESDGAECEFTKYFREAADRIEELEAALRFMLVDPPAALDEPDTDAEIIKHYRDVARAALAPEQDT
jgi:hypothetical protein